MCVYTFLLSQERPPPVPPSRSYTVAGNTKLGYPQTRVMKTPFPGKNLPFFFLTTLPFDFLQLRILSLNP